MKSIIYTDGAARDLDSLPRSAREQIEAALDLYAITGRGDVKRLRDRTSFRLRVGSYRVVFDADSAAVVVWYIGRRSTHTYRRI